MIILPADMLAAAQRIPPPEEWLLACLKMPSGDVWLSDRPVSPELAALIPVVPLAAVEDWGVLDDGGTVDGLLAAGSAGNLECPRIKITILRADQTKAQVDAIINQGIHNRRVELYRWFSGMVSAPVLIDTLFVQDKIELAESSMLWSFEAVGCLAAENPRISDLDDKGRSWPYVIGKAQGVPLVLLESQSSKYTELIGTVDGEEVTEEYTGLIRVKDATKLRSGSHLVNGEQVWLTSASGGLMRLTSRGQAGTEAQEHGSGSRIFPLNAVFRYAVCVGPIGSFEDLRTSNETELGDFVDLYGGDNVTLKPDLNPAQVWFNGRMPFLFKDQENQIDDKVFYGRLAGFDNAISCLWPSDINKDDGAASIRINFRRFSILSGTNYGYTEPKDVLVPTSSEAHLVSFSENLKNGKFSASQHSGNWELQQAYTEFRANGEAGTNDTAWITAPPPQPDDKLGEYHNYTGTTILGVVINSAYAHFMRCRFDFYAVTKNGNEFPIFATIGPHVFGFTTSSMAIAALNLVWQQQTAPFSDSLLYDDARIKMKLTVLESAGPSSYAWIRVGFAVAITPYPERMYYNIWAYRRYYKTEPSAFISSTFGRYLSSRGVFTAAKIRIKGTLRNTVGKATGTLKIYEGAAEIYSTSVTDGEAVDQTIELSAASWIDLNSTTIKAEVKLTSLAGEITEGSAGFEFDGGVQWLLSYESTTLDGLQVNYTDQLYVDAVSLHGADWTPARAVQWISQDKTTWAVDMLDIPALDARHAEYSAVGHVLNGLRSEERYQDIIREVLRQGFARPVQSGGKLSIVNHLTDAAALPSMTADLDSLFSKSQTFTTTNTPQLVQRIIVNYNKNLSTGEWDGKHELATGSPVQELTQIDLDLVDSAAAVQLAADWLYALKTVQLQVFGYAGNFKMLSAQKADIITMPSFLLNNDLFPMFAVNIKQDMGKGKTGKSTKILILSIRRM